MTDRDAPGRRDLLRALGLGLGATAGCLRLTGDATETPAPDTATPDADPPGDPDGTPSGTSEPAEEATAEPTDEASGSRIDGPQSVDFPLVDARNRLAQPGATVTGSRPERAWRTPIGEGFNARHAHGPVVTQTRVVTAGRTGPAAFDRADGAPAWRLADTLPDDYDVRSRLVHHDGSLYLLGQNRRTDDWELLVVDPADGGLQRDATLPIRRQDAEGVEEAPSAFTLDPGTGRAYVATSTFPNSTEQFADLLLVDLDSLAVRRERRLSPSPLLLEDAAVDSEVLVLTSDEIESADNVVAFDPETLERRWSGRFGLGETMPVLGDEHLYLATETERRAFVEALSRRDGSVAWRFELQDKPRNGVSLGPDGVYTVADGTLYRLDPADGTPAWSYTPDAEPGLRGSSHALPVVTSELLFLGSGFPDEIATIRALDPDSGTLEWRLELDEAEAFAPLVAGESLYTVGLGDAGSALYELR